MYLLQMSHLLWFIKLTDNSKIFLGCMHIVFCRCDCFALLYVQCAIVNWMVYVCHYHIENIITLENILKNKYCMITFARHGCHILHGHIMSQFCHSFVKSLFLFMLLWCHHHPKKKKKLKFACWKFCYEEKKMPKKSPSQQISIQRPCVYIFMCWFLYFTFYLLEAEMQTRKRTKNGIFFS